MVFTAAAVTLKQARDPPWEWKLHRESKFFSPNFRLCTTPLLLATNASWKTDKVGLTKVLTYVGSFGLFTLLPKKKGRLKGTINYAFRSDQLDLKEMQCISDSQLMVFWCILRINITFGYIIWNWQAYNVWQHNTWSWSSDFQRMMNIIGPLWDEEAAAF